MTSCPIGPAEGERPLKGGLLLPSGRNRRGPEGSSRKANVRRCWDHRVETMTRTPCLEEMPITTEAATAVLDATTPDVVNFGLWMQKEGYSPKTILDRTKTIRRMTKIGTLLDAEAVKSWVSKLPIKGGSKLNIFKAYASYSKWKGFNFDYPIVNNTEPLLPFIPLESELDALIAGSGRKLSAFLLALKETGARTDVVMSTE